jgi:ABC-type Zn uptake system ZnuABC Zn-binding protein ZnuA
VIRSPLLILAALIGLLSAATTCAQDTPGADGPLVLTALQATWSITRSLTDDTPIQVVNVPEDGREFAILRTYIERRKDRLADLFSTATAVVTVTNALPADPLYRYAREANIRVIDIDSALPFTYDTPGVALADMPTSDVEWADSSAEESSGTAPYFWLSLSNTMRMADIVAADLASLYPNFAATIATNLDAFKREILEIRGTYQSRLIAAGDDTVFALTGDFVYLTNDMGLFVDGYFIRQDLRWTEKDLAALTAHLKEREIRVVIHKWMPNEAIQSAIRDGGAELVVLETADPGRVVDGKLAADGLQQIHIENLSKITAALSH